VSCQPTFPGNPPCSALRPERYVRLAGGYRAVTILDQVHVLACVEERRVLPRPEPALSRSDKPDDGAECRRKHRPLHAVTIKQLPSSCQPKGLGIRRWSVTPWRVYTLGPGANILRARALFETRTRDQFVGAKRLSSSTQLSTTVIVETVVSSANALTRKRPSLATE
jgi:hypothetical protein